MTLKDQAKKHIWDAKTRRLYLYVEDYFESTDKLAFPSVREAARYMRTSQKNIADMVEGCEFLFMTSFYTTPPDPLGEHTIESYDLPT